MQAKNQTERRKRILAFTCIYLASLLLMFFILSAFGVHWTLDDDKGQPIASTQPVAAHNSVERADSLLHDKLKRVQLIDQVYAGLLSAPGSAGAVNDIRAQANEYAHSMSLLIDSIGNLAGDASDKNGNAYKSLASFFRTIMAERDAAEKGIASRPATAASTASKEMSGLPLELIKKDNEIAMLRAQLNRDGTGKGGPEATAAVDDASKRENDLLRAAFDDQQKDLNTLTDKYNKLKSENISLTEQVVQSRRALANGDNAKTAKDESVNKINSLEQKINDLNADLYFARVDCNLSRADAQEIISNARQRKELLSESLAMLNTLSGSSDLAVQKKAREKMVRLNHIATTLRD